MTEVKFRTFVIEFKNKPKHDTRWASVTERCKIHSGWCLIDPPMKWPKEENIKVIEHAALAAKDKEIELVRNAYNIEKQELLNKREAAEFHADHYRDQLERLIAEKDVVLNTAKNDYWFMTSLLERTTNDKYLRDAVNDCIERMKFRRPMFEVLQKYKGEG